MKIIDVFAGFNEIGLAEFRIDYLDSYVDKVIIGESDQTYSGIKKPLYFTEWLKSNPKYESKVTIHYIDLNHLAKPWDKEIFTRTSLHSFATFNFPKSKIILSDLDEIPSRAQIEIFKKETGTFHFHTPTFYRKGNWALIDNHSNWSLGIMTDANSFPGPNGGRFIKHKVLHGENCGAHFSYLGFNSAKVREKYASFAHTELDKASFSSAKLIDFCDQYKIDHIGRIRSKSYGLMSVLIHSEMSDVQKECYRKLPSMFDFEKISVSTIRRIWASAKISVLLNGVRIKKFKLLNNSNKYFRAQFSEDGLALSAFGNIVVFACTFVELSLSTLFQLKRYTKLLQQSLLFRK